MLTVNVTPQKLGEAWFRYVEPRAIAATIKRELRMRGFTVRSFPVSSWGYEGIEARRVRHSEPYAKRNGERRAARRFKAALQEASFV